MACGVACEWRVSLGSSIMRGLGSEQAVCLSLQRAEQRLVMLVLGLETSCDETGVALYDTERGLLAHRVYSQIAVHAEYGGVVPELASRDHVRKGLPLIREVMEEAGHTL